MCQVTADTGTRGAGEGRPETVASLPLSYGLKMAFRNLRAIVNYDCSEFRVTWSRCQRPSDMESSSGKHRGLEAEESKGRLDVLNLELKGHHLAGHHGACL